MTRSRGFSVWHGCCRTSFPTHAGPPGEGVCVQGPWRGGRGQSEDYGVRIPDVRWQREHPETSLGTQDRD